MKMNITITGITKEHWALMSPYTLEHWVRAYLRTPEYGNNRYKLVKIVSRKQVSPVNYFPKTIIFTIEVVSNEKYLQREQIEKKR